jgi:hypothetical protein
MNNIAYSNRNSSCLSPVFKEKIGRISPNILRSLSSVSSPFFETVIFLSLEYYHLLECDINLVKLRRFGAAGSFETAVLIHISGHHTPKIISNLAAAKII